MSHRTQPSWWALPALVLFAACADQPPPPLPASFERPADVAFVCLAEVGDRHRPVAQSNCADRFDRSDRYAMHALVTQTTRGEIAVVDLEDSRVLDSRRDIPGYTFVPVGEFPSRVVVAAQHPDLPQDEHPTVVYVANFGSRDIYVLDTSAMVDRPAGQNPVVQVVPVRADVAGESLRGGPADMVVSPSGDALFVSVPELSVVLRMPLNECSSRDTECVQVDQIQAIPVAESLNRTLASPAPPDGPEPYQFSCPDFQRADPAPVVPPGIPPDLAATPARPGALAVDAFCDSGEAGCRHRLLVSDLALPIVHVIDLDAFAGNTVADPAATVQDPLFTGTPTTDVEVTPRVPRRADASGDDTQYVYAIDATDSSVLVLQDGALLHPNLDPEQRPDRVPLGGNSGGVLGVPKAVALAVLTPDFDDQAPGSQYVRDQAMRLDGGAPAGDPDDAPTDEGCFDADYEEQNPAQLRGVFLAVALTDATIRLVDVHDMELDPETVTAPPTEAGEACRWCEVPGAPVLVRHLPRLANNFLPNSTNAVVSTPGPRASPNVFNDGTQYALRDDGQSPNPSLPGLQCMACSDPLQQAFPDQDGPDAGPGPDAGVDGGVDGGVDAGADAPSGLACTGDEPALVCAVGDPWYRVEETWALTYEGALPLSTGDPYGQRGQFRLPDADDNQTGTLEFISEIDACRSGLLGDDDAAEGMKGDMLVLLSDFPDPDSYPDDYDQKLLDDCATLRSAVNNDPNYVMRFGIRRAYQDYLVLDEETIDRAGDLTRSYELIVQCMNGRLQVFEIRTRESYAVIGSVSGFSSPVIPTGPNDRCVRDPAADPLLQGRALAGQVFRNRSFELTLRESTGAVSTPAGALLYFPLQASSFKLGYSARIPGATDVAIIPVQLRYLDIEKRMFLVDIYQRGLVPIRLDPLPSSSTTMFD